MFDLLWKPPRGPPGVKRRPLDKMLPENFKHFRNWGFKIYRTYYSAESDEQWNTLVNVLRHQTSLALGLLESEELREEDDEWMKRCDGDKSKWADRVNLIRKLFHLFAREDASLLDGMDIVGVREAVLKDVANGRFVVKAIDYDWNPLTSRGNPGWIQLFTGDLLALWGLLFAAHLMDTNKYMELVDRNTENDVWFANGFMPPFGDCSQVQIAKDDPLNTRFRVDP
ncbi:hypothetical protein FAUST_11252 [Fusarium austroamericanum]|uniref:Uncharacterized protein n=1 Tax=Fusarium austroamericanum TaxID=282268 RepID=A0AAN6BVB5_FUSAU|nr:hypothetical protein FAUST_11252 [Fusarium austroamericanum]